MSMGSKVPAQCECAYCTVPKLRTELAAVVAILEPASKLACRCQEFVRDPCDSCLAKSALDAIAEARK